MWWEKGAPDEGHVPRLSGRALFHRLGERLRPERASFVLAFALLLLSVATELAAPLLLRQLIDVDIAGASRDGSVRGIFETAALYLLVFATGSLASYIGLIVAAKMGLRLVARLKQDCFDHLLGLGADFFDHHPPGLLLARVESDAERLLNLFSEVAIAIVRSAVLLGGTLTVMLIADARITAIVFGFALPIFALALWFVRWMRRYYVRTRQSVANLSTFVTEFVPAVPILQVFGRENWALARLEAKSMARYRAELASERRDYAFWSFLATVEVSAVMLILYLGFGANLGGALTLGTLVLFIEYTRRLFAPLMQFAEQLNQIQKAFASADRVFGILDTPSRVRNREGTGKHVPADWSEIAFEDVSFVYATEAEAKRSGKASRVLAESGSDASTGTRVPEEGTNSRDLASQGQFPPDRDAPDQSAEWNGAPDFAAALPGSEGLRERARALDRVSFRIRRGERVALVGPSGGGKTTITNLLFRFYEPTSGRITVDGIDIREIPLAEWRAHLGLVLQDIHLFPGTVAENLRVFTDSIPDERLIAAIHALGAEDFLARLPNGLETRLSEGGGNLSMGERQLVCFARALVRDPDLLVLDEATSSIDPATERTIQATLARMLQGRTAFVIAHRLATVTSADRLLVLERGRLIQEGTHADLSQREGLYRALYHLQFRAGEVV